MSIRLSAAEVIRILILGIVMTSLGYFAYFFLIARIPVRSVAILSYFDPAVAVLVSAFILKEPIDRYGYIGAALIFIASIISELDSGDKRVAGNEK